MFIFLSFISIIHVAGKCRTQPTNKTTVIKSPEPHTFIEYDALPASFDWRDVYSLTRNQQQHQPNYCGSCWAMAVSTMLSDRITIQRKGAFPEVAISPQVLLSCDHYDNGCHGGNPLSAFQFIQENGITDRYCAPFRASGRDGGNVCNAASFCSICSPEGSCFVPNHRRYNIAEYGSITLEQFGPKQIVHAMMAEIYKRGPIICGIACPDDLYHWYADLQYRQLPRGVYRDHTGDLNTDHDIEVVSWGELDGTPYWGIRNSWGTFWGEEGWFKLIRGINNINVESQCFWAVLEDTWSAPKDKLLDDFLSGRPDQSRVESIIERIETKLENLEHKVGKLMPFQSPRSMLPSVFADRKRANTTGTATPAQVKEISVELDWRKKINIAPAGNPGSPGNGCRSIFAFTGLGALADRFNIQRNPKNIPLAFSVQAILNCNHGGDCSGGSVLDMYHHIQKVGVPHETCAIYRGINGIEYNPAGKCTSMSRCVDCPPPSSFPQYAGICAAITKYKGYFIEDFGIVSGEKNIKAEIQARGPISCSMRATQDWDRYTDGIYTAPESIELNMDVAVVGWGADHWIVRGSMGSAFGDQGYAKVAIGGAGIEDECVFAIAGKEEWIYQARELSNFY